MPGVCSKLKGRLSSLLTFSTSTSTITQTQISTALTVVTVTTTTSLSTQTSTLSTTVSATTIITPAKRAEGIKELNERSTGPITVCPSTAKPSSVPTYASACSGTVRYSSACSCLGGIVPQATTLSAVTVLVTATATAITTPTITSTSVAISQTTTTATVTSTSLSQVTCAPNSLYELNAVSQQYSYPIDIVITIDRTSPCGTTGFHITNICGTFNGNTVTYKASDNLGGADQCFYARDGTASFVDGAGMAFRVGDDQFNVFDSSNDFFDSLSAVNADSFGGGNFVALDCSSSRAACAFTSKPLS
jgi:hypothetical protein